MSKDTPQPTLQRKNALPPKEFQKYLPPKIEKPIISVEKAFEPINKTKEYDR